MTQPPSDDTPVTDTEEGKKTTKWVLPDYWLCPGLPLYTGRKRQQADRDPYEIYNVAARTITRCIDLWCNVDQVISTTQLIQQDEASRHGNLDEDDAAREVREKLLKDMYALFTYRNPNDTDHYLTAPPS